MRQPAIGVIGLGYVGLPLAVEFGKHFDTLGFDINEARVAELLSGHDRTLEVNDHELAASSRLTLTSKAEDLSIVDVFVVTVPTPVDRHKRPDLTSLESASRAVGRVMRPGATVVFESTVYPGATEEVCVPILEAESGLSFNTDFTVGYSPERINPGDQARRVTSIVKVTSGSTPGSAALIDELYARVIPAGTHLAPSIRVAEAAKVIENVQRDVNIALVNELAVLFGKMGIDTSDVLSAACTKWNFLPFRPGLVGGHCIGVDPFYLTYKAEELGYHPQMILSGRRINDGMAAYVADQVILALARKGHRIGGGRVLVLGLAFKEDVPDLRNTQVIKIVERLAEYGVTSDVVDPCVDADQARSMYNLELVTLDGIAATYDAAVVAVDHKQFAGIGPRLRAVVGQTGVIFDVKGTLAREVADGRL